MQLCGVVFMILPLTILVQYGTSLWQMDSPTGPQHDHAKVCRRGRQQSL